MCWAGEEKMCGSASKQFPEDLLSEQTKAHETF